MLVGLTRWIKNLIEHRHLRFDIVTSFLILFMASSIFILVYVYHGNKESSLYFAEKILSQATDKVTAKTVDYLNNASFATKMSSYYINPKEQNFLDDEELRLTFMQILKNQSNFKVIQLGLHNGDYLSVERVNAGTKYVSNPESPLQENIKFLSQRQDRSNKDQPKEIWTYYDEEGKVVSREENEFLVYDARKRPWYLKAMQKMKFNWSSVYNFSFYNVPGITASKPLFPTPDDRGEHIGVIGVDLLLDDVSKFLNENKVSSHGDVIVLNGEDQIVAASIPHYLVPSNSRNAEDIVTIQTLNDERFKEAYKVFKELGTTENKEFHFNHKNVPYIASFTQIPDEADNFWLVGIVVPEDDFLGLQG